VNQSIERARPTIFVGSKPVIAYVVAALMELAQGNDVSIEARGRSISKAVDTVQVIRTKYLSGPLRIRRIEFGSEPYPLSDVQPEERFVSTVKIILSSRGA
jgi:DNA-binding protein